MVGLAPPQGDRPRRILVLEDDEDLADLVSVALAGDGYEVDVARDGVEGLSILGRILPDLIISDVVMPRMDGLEFLRRLRAETELRHLPVILLTTRSSVGDVVTGFAEGADDYLPKPVDLRELLARARSKVQRPPVPADQLVFDRETTVLSERAFAAAATAEIGRSERGGYGCAVACLRVYEAGWVRERMGARAEAELMLTVGRLLRERLDGLDLLGRGEDGTFLVLSQEIDGPNLGMRLQRLVVDVVRKRLDVGRETVVVTPLCGFARARPGQSAPELIEEARTALAHAETHLDLRPIAFEEEMRRRARAAAPAGWAARLKARLGDWRFGLQVAATFAMGWGLPLLAYVVLDRVGLDVTGFVYAFVVTALVVTALLIWIEGFLSLRRVDPPELPDEAFGPVSAIIAAYLPNEAATIESTLEAFLGLDYPARTQIILAYNTPVDHPIEDRLRALALRDRRFVPLRVQGSTSKAQNVNAALSLVTSPVTAVYDADHQPDPDSFRRAWRWIATGSDVVQGHCFIRNGDASWVARTVAVEFEQIYAVSHPGRARLHGFGLFGGSNGFWRTDLLREIRMRGSMLTEDIDSAIRSVEAGRIITSDPWLVSRELSPTTLKGLTNQRLRWAQGWFQVAKVRVGSALGSPNLSFRQKLGMFHLLAWRESFPWLSMQVVPILGYWAWKAGGVLALDWFVPLLVFLTLFISVTGPGQLLFAWRSADPELRQRPSWFWAYLAVSVLFYAGYKNVLARVANLKEWMGEKAWKVTPRI